MIKQALVAFMSISVFATTSFGALENHYAFDSEEALTVDSSGKGRDAFIDDIELSWVNDEDRGGVLELGGNTSGFLVAETPELPSEGFSIMMWAYRDPLLAGGAGGANDGLFQLTLATDDLEFLPPPPTSGVAKVVGGWVQKADPPGVWGRVNDDFGVTSNLPVEYFMPDETWVHLTYRGNGEDFELVVNGDSSEGSVTVYDESLGEHDAIYIGRQGTETWGGRLDDFRVYSEFLSDEQIQAIMESGGGPGIIGDFNDSGDLDAGDMDLLTAAAASGANDPTYDLDNDQLVNSEDRRIWIEDLKNSYFGDSNLDGEFSSADFVFVFTSAKYETGEASLWADGDWDGDGFFTSGDFVAAFTGGGYEQGPRPSTAAVPEPVGALSLLFMAMAVTARRRT